MCTEAFGMSETGGSCISAAAMQCSATSASRNGEVPTNQSHFEEGEGIDGVQGCPCEECGGRSLSFPLFVYLCKDVGPNRQQSIFNLAVAVNGC
mmetsp:Transcript_62573/g.104017  ORF Transcript_62573/g.104017 Transcript_62573/m.104017 type:complete len:94 (+) Transcript_62573:1725-2006(+)